MEHRLVICLVALMSYLACFADTTCKISGDGDTVEVLSAILDQPNNTVNVSLGNDSNNIAANVTVTIEVGYSGNGGKKTYTGKVIVRPQQEVVLPIKIDAYRINSKYIPIKVDVVSLTGTKCQ